jgi:hypothetical protein
MCRVNTFFNPVACCFLYKAIDLSENFHLTIIPYCFFNICVGRLYSVKHSRCCNVVGISAWREIYSVASFHSPVKFIRLDPFI